MAAADKAREAHLLANQLHAACAGKGRPRDVDNFVSELRVLYPKWEWLPVTGVGFYLYVPYDDLRRIPMGVSRVASRIEGWSDDGRSWVQKDRRGLVEGWLDHPTHPDFGTFVKSVPVPSVWDRLGADDDFGR